MGIQSIYDRMPICIQNLMVSAKGYMNGFERYGGEYKRYREFLKEFDKKTEEEKQAFCDAEVRRFVKYAYENSPMYRELYAGIDVDSITGAGDLKKLPILEKEYLRANIEKAYTHPKEPIVEGHTGGTTGKSIIVEMTRSDVMRRMAMLDHFKAKHGFEHRRMKRASFNGKFIVPQGQAPEKKVFWRYNAACRQMIFSSFHITDENIPFYIKELERFRPDALDGFFSSILQIARYCERHSIKPVLRLKAIFTTSETVLQEGREIVERVFETKLYDQYASSEGAPFITECEFGRLHIEPASGVFEWPFGTDEFVVTSFTTHGTPLIRYRIGDSAERAEEGACPCGMGEATVKRLCGRTADYLVTSDGAHVSHAAFVFTSFPNTVKGAQLIQKRVGALTVSLAVDEGCGREEYVSVLTEKFKRILGNDTQVEVEFVDEIEKAPSGKTRFIINEIPEKAGDEL